VKNWQHAQLGEFVYNGEFWVRREDIALPLRFGFKYPFIRACF
jgi:hypothetical protein